MQESTKTTFLILMVIVILCGVGLTIGYIIKHEKDVSVVKNVKPEKKVGKFVGFALELPGFVDEDKKPIDFEKGLAEFINLQKKNAAEQKSEYYAEVVIWGHGIEKKMTYKELFNRLGICWGQKGQPIDCDPKKGGSK